MPIRGIIFLFIIVVVIALIWSKEIFRWIKRYINSMNYEEPERTEENERK